MTADRTPDARSPVSRSLAPSLDASLWSEYCRRTENAARLVMAVAPDDPLDRAEGLRYVARIARYGLTRFLEEGDPAHPVVTHSLPKLGGDNPDYVYSVAALSGAWSYRLRGRLGDSAYLGLGTYHGDVGTREGSRSRATSPARTSRSTPTAASRSRSRASGRRIIGFRCDRTPRSS